MSLIQLTTIIYAPIETCFDLARSVDAHMHSTAHTKERAIAGRTYGLCELGDTITWQAIHFGVTQKLSVQITEMQQPFYFRDEMTKGIFAAMKHTHYFETENGATKMTDEFFFKAPLGILGRFAEKLFLEKYMRQLLIRRNEILKVLAEKNNK